MKSILVLLSVAFFSFNASAMRIECERGVTKRLMSQTLVEEFGEIETRDSSGAYLYEDGTSCLIQRYYPPAGRPIIWYPMSRNMPWILKGVAHCYDANQEYEGSYEIKHKRDSSMFTRKDCRLEAF